MAMSAVSGERHVADLAGCRALVTGGAKRLGRAVALALARAGADIALHYRHSEADARATTEDVRALGQGCVCYRATLDDAAQGQALLEQVLRDAPLDLLVNSASVFPRDTLSELDERTALGVLQANAFAPLAMMRAFASQRRPGCIVNLLDTTIREYDREHVSYHLSKRLLHTLTRACALEFAPLVRVNAIAPGAVLAPEGQGLAYLAAKGAETPLQAYGNAGHIAEAAVFLARSTFITGQTIYVDGGRHLQGGAYD